MKNVYFIKEFDFDCDIPIEDRFKNRDVYYSEDRILEDLKYSLESIHEEYQEKTNKFIDYDDLFTKFRLIIEIHVVSLNHRSLVNEKDYEKYLKEVKTISKEELKDYLLSYCDFCILSYDHNLNLKYTYSGLFNEKANNIFYQFSFSYKALFPNKYHVSKYQNGDRVLYGGNEFAIYKKITENTIYTSDNPLGFLYGYSLFDENDGSFFQDDKWSYFVVDEDLKSLPIKSRIVTNEEIDNLYDYISDYYKKSYHISNIPLNFEKESTKIIRSDDCLSVSISIDTEKIIINNLFDRDLSSYILFKDESPIIYVISYINIIKNMKINEIEVRYNNEVIDTISINKEFSKGDKISITRYID